MCNWLLNILLITFFTFIPCLGDFSYDPNKISLKNSSYYQEAKKEQLFGEQFIDVCYGSKIVFHILRRHVPIFNALICEAKYQKVQIKCKSIKDGFFTTSQEITGNFYLSPVENIFIEIEPEDLVLKKSRFGKYYVKIKNEGKTSVSEHEFTKLKLLKESIAKNKLIRIDLRNLDNFSKMLSELVIIDKAPSSTISDDMCCLICYEKEKNMVFLPCKHLHTCEGCSALVVDCPICREPIIEKMRVFY